jgi:hypothetical protein
MVMRFEERSMLFDRAKRYGKHCLGWEERSDTDTCEHIADLLALWANEHTDPDAKESCLEAEKLVRKGPDGLYGSDAQWRLFLGRWGACGMPLCLPVDLHWAAAMCASNVPSEFLSAVEPPWSSFAMEIPRDLGFIDDDGYPATFGGLQINRAEPGENIVPGQCVSDGDRWVTLLLWHHTPKPNHPSWRVCRFEELADDLVAQDGDTPAFLRTMKLAGKLFLGAMMAFQSGLASQSSDRGKVRRSRIGKIPSDLEFVVGSPVHVRTVDFVRDYIRLGPRKMRGRQTVQTLVRGYWKNQPCGPRGTERKFIHIEPYWRGPEDAPIAVRPHILKGAQP